MRVMYDSSTLSSFVTQASSVSPLHPVVISKYYTNSMEIEMDGVALGGDLVVYGVSEHIENAGVHSGDATLVFPTVRLPGKEKSVVEDTGKKIAKALNISGPFNIQFLVTFEKDSGQGVVRVIECNLRASRSFPFISKVMGVNMIDIATKAIMGRLALPLPLPPHLASLQKSANAPLALHRSDLGHVGVKAAQFSFSRLDKADPVVGVEMASTGEVGCLGLSVNEAYLKSFLAVNNNKMPSKRHFEVLLSTAHPLDFPDLVSIAQSLQSMSYGVLATPETHQFLLENGITGCTLMEWSIDNSKYETNPTKALKNGLIDLAVILSHWNEPTNDFYNARRLAVDFHVPLITNIQIAKCLLECLKEYAPHRKVEESTFGLEIKSYQEYFAHI